MRADCATPRSVDEQYVGIGQGPHGQVVGRPRPYARYREQLPAGLRPIGAAVQDEHPVGDSLRQRLQRAPTAARHRQRLGVDLGELSRGREVSDSASNAGVPYSAASRPSSVRAPLTEICWPMTARTAISKPSTAPGERRPGRAATNRAELTVGTECFVHGHRVGIEIEQPPYPRDCGDQIALVGSRNRHRTWSPPSDTRTSAGPWGRRIVRVSVVSSKPSTPGMARAARKSNVRLRRHWRPVGAGAVRVRPPLDGPRRPARS